MHIQPSWFLSHQHIAHAEMVYLHVCEITASTQSEVSTLKFFTQNPKPLIRIERLLAPEKKQKTLHPVKHLAARWSGARYPRPAKRLFKLPKETLRGPGAANARNYYLT